MTPSGTDELGSAGAGRASGRPLGRMARGGTLLALYRAAGVLAAFWTLIALIGTDGGSLWADIQVPDRSARLTALTLAAIATALLGLYLPGGQEITLLGGPLLLAWWQLGLPEALAVVSLAALVGHVTRLPSIWAGAGATARVVLAAAAGLSLAQAITPPGTPGPGDALTLPLPGPLLDAMSGNADVALGRWLAGALVVVTATGLTWMALEWLDARLAAANGRRREQRALPRLDLVANLLLIPVTLALQVAYVVLGFERFSVLLAGAGALLLVVRASVNLRTVHAALARTHGVVLEEREKLATLFNNSGEGIYTVDGQLRVSAVNPAMADLLGLDADRIEGRACAEVCHFEDGQGGRLCPERCPLKRAFAEGQPVSQDVVIQAPEQPPKHLQLTYAAVRDAGGRLDQGIGIARDISAQKEAQAVRDEFVSLVTHELRNPLTVSMAYVGLMKRALRVPAAVDAKKALYYLESIESSEQHLLRLVNNLLDVARVERTDLPLDLEDVDLDRLLEDVVRGAQTLAEKKQQTVTVVAPAVVPPYWGSELYLREIFSNLLSNAVKYTPEGGNVTVHVAVISLTDEKPPLPVSLSGEDTNGRSAVPPEAVAQRPAAARAVPGGAPPDTAPARSATGAAGTSASAAASPATHTSPNAGTSRSVNTGSTSQTSAVHDTSGRWLEVGVADTGYGMSAEDLGRLFTKFFRSGNAEVRKERGTGLGLALTQRMVQRLDGTIHVTSVLGAGSTFTVRLPLVAPPEPAITGSSGASSSTDAPPA